MNKIYTGIGSRETPKEVLDIFFKLGCALAKRDYTLRSGGAEGADTYFENGCDKYNGNKEIYLPWKGFNNSKSNLYTIKQEWIDLAKKNCPYFDKMKQGGQKCIARDMPQVLGEDLNNPSDFVICYTKDGKLDGGTKHAIMCAKDNNIKVFNAGGYTDLKLFVNDIKEFVMRKE